MEVSDVYDWIPFGRDGPAKFEIDIKSDCLIICFTFATKSPGRETHQLNLKDVIKLNRNLR